MPEQVPLSVFETKSQSEPDLAQEKNEKPPRASPCACLCCDKYKKNKSCVSFGAVGTALFDLERHFIGGLTLLLSLGTLVCTLLALSSLVFTDPATLAQWPWIIQATDGAVDSPAIWYAGLAGTYDLTADVSSIFGKSETCYAMGRTVLVMSIISLICQVIAFVPHIIRSFLHQDKVGWKVLDLIVTFISTTMMFFILISYASACFTVYTSDAGMQHMILGNGYTCIILAFSMRLPVLMSIVLTPVGSGRWLTMEEDNPWITVQPREPV